MRRNTNGAIDARELENWAVGTQDSAAMEQNAAESSFTFQPLFDKFCLASEGGKATIYRRGKQPQPVCGYVEVVAKTCAPDGSNWSRLLRWKTRTGEQKQAVIRMRDLLANDGGRGVIGDLVDQGLFVFPGQVAATVEYILMAPTPTKVGYVSSQIGWAQDINVLQAKDIQDDTQKPNPPSDFARKYAGYLLPDRFIGAEADVIFSSDLPHAYRTQGTLDDWRQYVGKRCQNNSRLLLACSCAFAAPLLRLIGAESGGVHLHGPSSLGKTTALKIAGSICGGGGARGFMNLWRATDNALEGLAALHNDGLLILDELHQLDPKKASEIAYLLANESGKSRMRNNTSLRKSLQWKLIFLSSGELTLEAHAAKVSQQTTAGTDVRMLNVPADAGAGYGMFEYLHGVPDAKTFADSLRDASVKYYGTALRAYLEKLVADQQGAIEYVETFRDEFIKREWPKDASGEVGRALDRFALIAAAGELATKYGITGWRHGEATTAIRRCFEAWLEARGTVGAIDADRAINQIRALIERNATKFGRLGEDGFAVDTTSFDRLGFIREHSGHTEYLILPEVFKREFCRGSDVKVVVAEMKARGFLRTGEDRSQVQVRLPRGLGKRAYCILDTLFN